MTVSTIPGTQISQAETQSTTKKSLTALADFDGFLKLFVTQLKYQDPLSPASQEDFLAQTAQFSSVEQLFALNQKMGEFSQASRMSAASLIGRKVEGTARDDKGTESPVTGLVAQIEYGKNGELLLGLQDGSSVAFANVTAVAEA